MSESEYEVVWAIEVSGESDADAASQAWTMLVDAANGDAECTMLVVRSVPEGTLLGVFDMADSRGPVRLKQPELTRGPGEAR